MGPKDSSGGEEQGCFDHGDAPSDVVHIPSERPIGKRSSRRGRQGLGGGRLGEVEVVMKQGDPGGLLGESEADAFGCDADASGSDSEEDEEDRFGDDCFGDDCFNGDCFGSDDEPEPQADLENPAEFRQVSVC